MNFLNCMFKDTCTLKVMVPSLNLGAKPMALFAWSAVSHASCCPNAQLLNKHVERNSI